MEKGFYSEQSKHINGFHFENFSDLEWDKHNPQRVDIERNHFVELLNNGPSNQVHLQHYVIEPKINHIYPHNYLEANNLKQLIKHQARFAFVYQGIP